jgi:transcriptional regulator with XRE-family HTH domain
MEYNMAEDKDIHVHKHELTFGTKLKAAYTVKKFTRASFARACGISSQTLINWEKGRKRPSYESLIKIAEILKVPASDLAYEVYPEKNQDQDRARITFARARMWEKAIGSPIQQEGGEVDYTAVHRSVMEYLQSGRKSPISNLEYHSLSFLAEHYNITDEDCDMFLDLLRNMQPR